MIQHDTLKRHKIILTMSVFLIILFYTVAMPQFTLPVQAQPLDFNKNLAVYMTIFGLNETTGQLLAFIKAHNMTQSDLVNGTQLFATNNKTPGVAQITLILHNATMNVGEQYSACIVVIKDTKMVCMTDYKTPYPRPQILDFSIH